MRWTPHVTVAAVVEQQEQFLLVEEHTGEGLRLNQPAGHWEQGETLVQAVAREVLEETGWSFTPQGLLGIYSWTHPQTGITFLRFAFTGSLSDGPIAEVRDPDIQQVCWMSAPALAQAHQRHRSPLVARCAQDYRRQSPWPLSLVAHA